MFLSLIEKGYNIPSKSTPKFSTSITKLYLLCLLYLGNYDKIISVTNDWKNDPNWFLLYGTYRASALKRSIELKKSISETEDAILKSIEIFLQIFQSENYPVVACTEAHKLVKEIDYLYNSKNQYSEIFTRKCLSFIADHYFGILGSLNNESIETQETQDLLKRMYNIKLNNNPIHNVKWFTRKTNLVYDSEHIEELESDGYKIVEIYHIPERSIGISNFMFAQDKDSNQFYLSVDSFENGWNRWGYIKINTKLAIKYSKLSTNGKPTAVSEIVEIDQYEV